MLFPGIFILGEGEGRGNFWLQMNADTRRCGKMNRRKYLENL